MKPKIIKITGKISSDARGSVKFFNEFKIKDVKRFYQVENLMSSPIRAFHGHMEEGKYVYVPYGKILLCAIYLDDKNNPSKKNKVHKFFLSQDDPQIVYVPPRYANGFKSLKKGSKVIFFSTSTLEKSQKDDYRFPYNYWGKEIWDQGKF